MRKVYLVNTNKKNNPQHEVDMIHFEKVAAYFSPWKYYIDEIEEGDMVFLYSSNVGIIARGIASGVTKMNDVGNEKNEEHFMPLNHFEILNTPLPASTISSIIKDATDPRFKLMWNQTLISIPTFLGTKLWEYMTTECI